MLKYINRIKSFFSRKKQRPEIHVDKVATLSFTLKRDGGITILFDAPNIGVDDAFNTAVFLNAIHGNTLRTLTLDTLADAANNSPQHSVVMSAIVQQWGFVSNMDDSGMSEADWNTEMTRPIVKPSEVFRQQQ
jgi:hypothetical protein